MEITESRRKPMGISFECTKFKNVNTAAAKLLKINLNESKNMKDGKKTYGCSYIHLLNQKWTFDPMQAIAVLISCMDAATGNTLKSFFPLCHY